MIDVIQYHQHTIIYANGRHSKRTLKPFLFTADMTEHKISVRHWFGHGIIVRRRLSNGMETIRRPEPGAITSVITLEDKCVRFECHDKSSVCWFKSHRCAVAYANKLVLADVFGNTCEFQHCDSGDDEWQALIKPFEFSGDKRVGLSSVPFCQYTQFGTTQSENGDTRLFLELEDKSYGIYWAQRNPEHKIFHLDDLRIVGNLPLRPQQWSELIDVLHNVLVNLHKAGDTPLIAEYNDETHEYCIKSCSTDLWQVRRS